MLRRAVAVGAVVLAVLVGSAPPAHAHIELQAVSPSPGSVVADGVDAIELTFSGPIAVDGATVELVPAEGEPLALVVRGGADATVLVAAVPDGTIGSFTVRWAASAADGHPVSGTFGLGFGGAPALGDPPGPPADHAAAPVPGATDVETARQLLQAARTAVYVGLAVLVGGWIFVALAWPGGGAARSARRLLWGGLVLAAAGTAVGYGAQAAVQRRDLGAALDADAWRSLLELPFGRAWAARAALLVLAVPVVRALGRHGEAAAGAPWWRVAAAAVGVGLLRTPGFVSHASEGDTGALGSVADLVHLLGIAAWLGGLVMLCAAVLPRRRAEELAAVLPRFATLAAVAMSAIVLGGAVMSWQLLDGIGSLWSTEFGRVLAGKLAVFAAALGAAHLSRRWVARRLVPATVGPGADGAVRPFVLSAAAEVALGIAVVAIASALVGTSPGA